MIKILVLSISVFFLLQFVLTNDVFAIDSDQDGIDNTKDNCPKYPNKDQKDSDNDGIGNACDSTPYPLKVAVPLDSDKDGISDSKDNCPKSANKDQKDSDGDGVGDVCDTTPVPLKVAPQDSDQDGISDTKDNCPKLANKDQADLDKDAIGDACDVDDDNDKISDTADKCPTFPESYNNNQDDDGCPDNLSTLQKVEEKPLAPIIKKELSITESKQPAIPSWIKSNADWWSKGQIEDSDFVQGIEYMLNEKIITISDVHPATTQRAQQVPSWVKTTAGWWSDGLVSDTEFANGIGYLVSQGIIGVDPGIIKICTTVYVEPSAKKVAEPRDENEFSKISDALDYAVENDYDCVNVDLAAGTYNEGTLEISRDTNFLGESKDSVTISGASIVNEGSHQLGIKDVTLSESQGDAAVWVSNNAAVTRLETVDIVEATGNGLYQNGGDATLDDVTISNTIRQTSGEVISGGGEFGELPAIVLPVPIDSGAGIFLKGGVKVILQNIIMDNNANGALRIDGENTKVYSNELDVRNSGFASELYSEDGISVANGAVEARNGALLLMENGIISNNDFVGLLIMEGAKAHVRDVDVEDTNSVNIDGRNLGGINVALKTSADAPYGISEIEMHDFVVSGADLVGISVNNGKIYAEGEVSENVIGIYLGTEADVERIDCLDVASIDNEMNLDSVVLPVPGAYGDEEALECVEVPFECPWCS